MFPAILFSLILGHSAFGASPDVVDCEPALIAFKSLLDRRPHENQFVGRYELKKVFIKLLKPQRYHPLLWGDLDLIARILGNTGMGPAYHGMTFATPSQAYAMVFDFVDGALVYNDDVIPEWIDVSPQTLADIDRAVEVLSCHRIVAHDLQFLFTAAGRAVLIDYDQYEFVETEQEAWSTNDSNASWLRESLRLALRLDRAA